MCGRACGQVLNYDPPSGNIKARARFVAALENTLCGQKRFVSVYNHLLERFPLGMVSLEPTNHGGLLVQKAVWMRLLWISLGFVLVGLFFGHFSCTLHGPHPNCFLELGFGRIPLPLCQGDLFQNDKEGTGIGNLTLASQELFQPWVGGSCQGDVNLSPGQPCFDAFGEKKSNGDPQHPHCPRCNIQHGISFFSGQLVASLLPWTSAAGRSVRNWFCCWCAFSWMCLRGFSRLLQGNRTAKDSLEGSQLFEKLPAEMPFRMIRRFLKARFAQVDVFGVGTLYRVGLTGYQKDTLHSCSVPILTHTQVSLWIAQVKASLAYPRYV